MKSEKWENKNLTIEAHFGLIHSLTKEKYSMKNISGVKGVR